MADLRALTRFSTSTGLTIAPRLVLDTDRVAAGGMVQATAVTPLSFQTTGANSDITLSATRSITLGATTGAITLDAVLSSNFTVAGSVLGAVTLTLSATNAVGAGTADIALSCKNTASVTAITFDVNATGAITLDSASSSNFTVTAASPLAQTLTLSCTNGGAGTGNVTVTCEDVLTLSTTGGAGSSIVINSISGLNIDCVQCDLDATGALSIDAATNSNITLGATSAGAQTLTISCTNGGAGAGNLTLACKSTMDLDCTTYTLDATAAISLDAATASNISVSGAAADLTFGARGVVAAITLNQASDTVLSGFTATSIVGALNELKSSGGAAAVITTTIPGGASTTDSFASVTDGGAEWLYIIQFAGNIRVGILLASWDQSVPDAKLYETVTTDMGVTTDVTFTVAHSGALMRLTATNAGVNVYNFKALRRLVTL